MDDNLYSLYIINGDVFDWADDPYTPSLMFRGLSWEKAVELAHLSFAEGYEVVIWRADKGDMTGGAEECRDEKPPKTA